MKIVMMTNTFTPIVGGLERSVMAFADEYRKKGHRVLIVAPAFEKVPQHERGVIRIPAIQNFNGSDFSVQLPLPEILTETLNRFHPDIIHSHHPFLIGDTALRVSAKYRAPLVFTHHILFEQNTHYVFGDSEAAKRFVVELSTGYANLADQVFAPSESIRTLLLERGVKTTVEVVPTGIYPEKFVRGNGTAIRKSFKIPARAFVAGYIGRLAPEKNLEFLARAVSSFLNRKQDAHFLVVGEGPLEESMKTIFAERGVSERSHFAGVLKGKQLIHAYHALDIFAFSSQSETQGLVLTEAMASGVPVVAVDAPGVREVVKDGENGRLLSRENERKFSEALYACSAWSPQEKQKFKQAALKTAKGFSMHEWGERALEIYKRLLLKEYLVRPTSGSSWEIAQERIKTELRLAVNFTKAAAAVVTKGGIKD